MVENKEGFIEPIINQEKCIECGMCAKRCPQLSNVLVNRINKVEIYAAKNKDKKEQKESSSGGIFSNLANYVLENKGVVYGSAWNNKLILQHIGIHQKEELEKLRGSKYVQSNTKNTFKEVKEYLANGTMVAYCGTPCQIAGLRSFLGKDDENLILIDLVCHGVPSPKLFEKYKKWLETRYKQHIEKYYFRAKEEGTWGKRKIKLSNGKEKYVKHIEDGYYKAFIEGKTLRESCYNCKYANTSRIGDLTIGDYWGIEKQHPKFYDENGVSLIMVNTNKGKKIFEKIKSKINYIHTTMEKIQKENHNLTKPTNRPKKRDTIYGDMNNLKFKKMISKKDRIKNIIPTKAKKLIKKYFIRNELR